jgi:WD40 repeat protein
LYSLRRIIETPTPPNNSSQDEGGGDGMGLRHLNDDSIGIFPHNQPIYSVAFSPFDEDVLATGGGDDRVRVWSLSTGKETLELEKFEDTVTAVGFSHDGKLIHARMPESV